MSSGTNAVRTGRSQRAEVESEGTKLLTQYVGVLAHEDHWSVRSLRPLGSGICYDALFRFAQRAFMPSLIFLRSAAVRKRRPRRAVPL